MSHIKTSNSPLGRVFRWGSSAWRRRHLPPSLPESQIALVSALETLSDSISSARTAPDVMACMVEEAKRFTGLEKLLVFLVDDDGGVPTVDRSTLVVRGARATHSEEWWGGLLPGIVEAVFADGAPFFEASVEHHAWLFAVPMRMRGEPLGVLVAVNSLDHKLSEEHTAYLAILSAASSMALTYMQLAEESRYSLLASERERISREMHDGIAQSLFSISLGLEVCRKQVRREPEKVAVRLEELQSLLNVSQTELRRYIYDLRPVKLQELGLRGAIEYWLKEIAPVGATKTQVEEYGARAPLSAEVEFCLYGVAREAVTNAVKHASSSSIRVRIQYASSFVLLIVEDDGRGFGVDGVVNGEVDGKHVGLRSLAERVRAVGGELSIDSAPGSGCRVAARVPC